MCIGFLLKNLLEFVGDLTGRKERAAIVGKHEASTAYESLMIRIGFWGILYYNCNKEIPK